MPRYKYPPPRLGRAVVQAAPSPNFSQKPKRNTNADYGSEMSIVAKQGIWDDATYPWTDQTSAGLMGSVVTEIDAWVSAISSNASIVANGMTPVKERDPSSSTNSGVSNGFGYEFPDTSIGLNADGPTYPTLLVHGTETSLTVEVGDEFEDDTQNNGFGDTGVSSGHTTVDTTSGTAGFDNQVIIVTGTTDGEEFLAVSFRMGTGNLNGGFLVSKDQNGYWMFSLRQLGFAYDSIQGYWTGRTGLYDTDPTVADGSSSQFGPYIMEAALAGASSRAGYNEEGQILWTPPTDKIYAGRGNSSAFGEYKALSNGTEQILGLGYQSPAIVIPV